MSQYSFKRVTNENPLKPEELEKIKLGVVKFLASGVMNDADILLHLIVAAADTRYNFFAHSKSYESLCIGRKCFSFTFFIMFTLFFGSSFLFLFFFAFSTVFFFRFIYIFSRCIFLRCFFHIYLTFVTLFLFFFKFFLPSYFLLPSYFSYVCIFRLFS